MKDKLRTMPKGRQFDFNETHIFGKFDLFCRRAIKLIDMFSTIHQVIAVIKERNALPCYVYCLHNIDWYDLCRSSFFLPSLSIFVSHGNPFVIISTFHVTIITVVYRK
jgi:hypothetical protein